MSDTTDEPGMVAFPLRVESELEAAILAFGEKTRKPGEIVRKSQVARVLLWQALAANGICPSKGA
jgi:hypothetical protein